MAKLELYYPTKPYSVNQAFGVNGAYYRANGINVAGHNGVDLRASHGQPVYASHDGIAYYEVDDNQGDGFVIRTTEQFDFVHPSNPSGQAYFKTIYWHLCPADPRHPKYDKRYVPTINTTGGPTTVKRGDLIGYADSTGFSAGDHLHYGLKPIKTNDTQNPEDATDLGIGAFANVLQLNGYSGAIDPTPYFNGKYAQDTAVLAPDDAVAVIAATEQAKGNTTLANQLWAIVGIIKAFLAGK